MTPKEHYREAERLAKLGSAASIALKERLLSGERGGSE